MLATHSGSTCGTLPAIPEALQSKVQGGYTVTYSGDRTDHASTDVTEITVDLGGSDNKGTFTVPRKGASSWNAKTGGYNFAGELID